MRSIRGGKGLGDALYVQAVARHLVLSGERLEVCTVWPEVFKPLGDAVKFSDFRRDRIDVLAHYSLRKPRNETGQFEDVCIQAGIKDKVDFRLDWQITDKAFVSSVKEKAGNLPIVLVQLPRAPMGRTDGFGQELLPDCRVIQRAIDRIRLHSYVVQIGAGRPQFRFTGLDLDLSDKTSVSQLFDLACVSHGMLGYVSFIVPLAESLRKPCLLVWSRRGLKGCHQYIQQITPKKILHRATSTFVYDDCKEEELDAACNAFLRA